MLRRTAAVALAGIAALSGSALAVPVLTGPPPRPLTDPKSITSAVQPLARPVAVADLFNSRGGSDASWTPDGRRVVLSTNLTGRYNLWIMPSEGGFPQQLTQSDDRQSGIALSPDGKTAVFESDVAGAEIYDLFAVPLDGGAVTNLTNSPHVTENGAHFSPDGKMLAFVRRADTGASTDVAVMDLATRKVTLLTHETVPDHSWVAVGFADNGRTLIANRLTIGGSESAVWRIDVVSGKAQALTDARPDLYNVASAVSADGRTVALTTEVDGAHQAALLDTASGAITPVKPDAWEQQSGSLSPDGRAMVFSSNVDGQTELFVAKAGTVARVDLPPGTNGEASSTGSSLSADGTRLLVSHQASNTPFDYWSVDLAAHRATQLTALGLAGISPSTLPGAQVVHYKSRDGTVVSALLWVPFNLKRDGKAPAVLYAHGGPTSQTVDSFSRTALALASRGYVVIAPNPRGSTGYGRAFMEGNRKDLGGGDLEDEVAGVKFLIATGYVDGRKIGITGGSYGGYMTLMAIGKAPGLWAAAVEQYGIIDWFAMYQTEAPPLQQYERSLIGDPATDKAVYTATSPMTYIKAATAPLLVLQGDNDIRVPKAQAEAVVATLKAQGRTVDAHYYAGEGHGFAKRENQIDSIERMVAWFDKYLKGGGGT